MDRVITDSGFAGDAGTADLALSCALDAWAAGTGSDRSVRRVLPNARVLVPLVAVATGVTESGAEKGTDMAVVTLRGADGKVALPAFTSVAALAEWNPQARPLPITAARAAEAALFENADLLVLDPAGPVTFLVAGAALRALAAGRAPVPIVEDRDIVAALRALLDAEAQVRSAVLVAGDEDGELDGVLALAFDGDPDTGPQGAVHRLAAALAADPVLRDRLERGLDVAVLPAGKRLTGGLTLLDRDPQ